jgi:SAM-dependent methyltransferase
VNQTIPLPPREYALRVGCVDSDDAMEIFVRLGLDIRNQILETVPAGWSWEGKRVLDFGCGCGRLLRHFAANEATVAEIHGVDIDGEAVDWVRQYLCPPIASASQTGHEPPLPFPDSHFDLVLATSVFTHITDQWSAWLLEMQRILKPDGLLISTFLGPGTSEQVFGEKWDDDSIGMNPLGFWGEPFVFHSEWWLRAHWGRLFEILELHQSGFGAPSNRDIGHGYMLLRPRDVSLTIDDLERDEPDEPRYITSRRHHWRQLATDGVKVASLLGQQPTPYTSPYVT